MNLLHDIDSGSKEEMNVIIEIPRDSHNKYEIDKKTGLIKLDRANYGPTAYPFDYGFVPQTLWDDGDALDVVLLATYPLAPGILVEARPIGILRMIDDGEGDDKVIAVPVSDRRWEHVHDIGDVNPHTLKEITHYFENNKKLKAKPTETVTNGYEGKEAAQAAFERAKKLYSESK
jgi:inorganic pyrophosphatase